jgi:hypothetical protein
MQRCSILSGEHHFDRCWRAVPRGNCCRLLPLKPEVRPATKTPVSNDVTRRRSIDVTAPALADSVVRRRA